MDGHGTGLSQEEVRIEVSSDVEVWNITGPRQEGKVQSRKLLRQREVAQYQGSLALSKPNSR